MDTEILKEGMVVTEPEPSICKCCGRRMGFSIKKIDLSWLSVYLDWNCFGNSIASKCNKELYKCGGKGCAVVHEDVDKLATYYAETIMLLVNKYEMIAINLYKDPVVLATIQKLKKLTRNTNKKLIKKPHTFTTMTKNDETKERNAGSLWLFIITKHKKGR